MSANSLYAKIKEFDKVIILVASIGLSIGGGKLIPSGDIIDLKSKHEEQKARSEMFSGKLATMQAQIDSIGKVNASLVKTRDSVQVVLHFLEKK